MTSDAASPSQSPHVALSAREVYVLILLKVRRNEWEELRTILSQRSHPWMRILDHADYELFLDLTLALSYVVLGETQHSKERLERILQFAPEEGRAQLLFAYINLIENSSEEALPRYTTLLHHAELRSHVARILDVLKKTSSPYTLTLERPWSFFYKHYRLRTLDLLYVLTQRLRRGFVWMLRQLWPPWQSFLSGALWVFLIGLMLLLSLPATRGALFSSGSSAGALELTWQKMRQTLHTWGIPINLEQAGRDLPIGIGDTRIGDTSTSTDSGSYLSQAASDANLASIELTEEVLDSLFLSADGASSRSSPAFYKESFARIKKAIYANDPNYARVLYNTVLRSDPPIDVTERFAILMTFMREPQLPSFKNTISFADISKSPETYRGTYWKLRGVVAKPRIFTENGNGNGNSIANIVSGQGQNKQLSGGSSFVAEDNAWICTFTVHPDQSNRDLVEVLLPASMGVLRAGESYEILMQLIGVSPQGRPYMQALALARVQ